ncbi:MAG: branched-chain amino acid aminotransferase [Candidatus Hodarchaeales archaeon]|jgi:branched-chain amino acid aminotransferase
MKINVKFIAESELKPKYESEEDLGFGKLFTDRMFVMRYENGAWEDPPRIKKFSPIQLDPSSICLHYGQTIFEGQKAFSTSDGHLNLFRPEMNTERFNQSARRMAMPEVNPEVYLTGLIELLKLEKDWAPKGEGSSIYIRPTMIGTEAGLGVRSSNRYLFYIILSPSGPFYPEGFNCIKIFVSEQYSRAAPGGTGAVKAGGNYGGSLLAGQIASEFDCSQVLWLDSTHRKYIEEVGAANCFFVYEDILYTAPLTSGTILPGVTRESTIKLARDMGYTVKEETMSIDVIIEGIHNGKVSEIFNCGTAASITPIGNLHYQGKEHIINNSEIGEISKNLYTRLTNIQYGRTEDPYGWMMRVI